MSMATIIPSLASACDAFAKSYLAQVFGLKIHQSMRRTPSQPPCDPSTPQVPGHGKFPHRWDWSSPIAWGCPVQFGPKLTKLATLTHPYPSSPIYPSKCSHICCVKLSNYMLSTMPSAWHCGPQCSGVEVTTQTLWCKCLEFMAICPALGKRPPWRLLPLSTTTTWWDPLVSHLQANWDFHSHAVFVRTSW